MFDVDGSGKIDKKELVKILGSSSEFKDTKEEYWENIIKEVDKNGDGEVIIKIFFFNFLLLL